MTTVAPAAVKRKSNYRSRSRMIIHIILIIGSFVMIFPFVWMILTSFKSNGESLLIPPTILPREWLTENLYRGYPYASLRGIVLQHADADVFTDHLRAGFLQHGRICLCQTAFSV